MRDLERALDEYRAGLLSNGDLAVLAIRQLTSDNIDQVASRLPPLVRDAFDEQVRSYAWATAASDLFSFGCREPSLPSQPVVDAMRSWLRADIDATRLGHLESVTKHLHGWQVEPLASVCVFGYPRSGHSAILSTLLPAVAGGRFSVPNRPADYFGLIDTTKPHVYDVHKTHMLCEVPAGSLVLMPLRHGVDAVWSYWHFLRELEDGRGPSPYALPDPDALDAILTGGPACRPSCRRCHGEVTRWDEFHETVLPELERRGQPVVYVWYEDLTSRPRDWAEALGSLLGVRAEPDRLLPFADLHRISPLTWRKGIQGDGTWRDAMQRIAERMRHTLHWMGYE